MKLSLALFLACLINLIITVNVLGQAHSSKNYFRSDKEWVKQQPKYSIYGDNYFITGSQFGKTPTEENSDAKFEIGFKYRLTDLVLPGKLYAFLTYRQKSFWDIYQESLPFRETNYNPGIGFAKPILSQNRIKHAFFLRVEHESNGRDEEFSRSWNFLSLQYFYFHKNKWQLRLKAWHPFGDMENNEDLLDYIGHGSIGLAYRPQKWLILESQFRKALNLDKNGSIKLSASLKLSKKTNQYLLFQYYYGYAESLITYNEISHMLRLGVVLKDLSVNFED